MLDPTQMAPILESVAEAIVSVDSSRRIVFFNHGAQRIFGYTPEEILGRPLRTLLPERFRASHAAQVGEFAQTGSSARESGRRMEVVGVRKGGEEFHAEASISRAMGPDGPVVTAVLRDVTRRRRARQELAKRERQLSDAQKIAHIGSWEWDIAADEVSWSDEMCRIYGEEPGTRGNFSSFLQRVHPDDRERVRRAVEAAIGSGEPFEFDHRTVLPDGTVRLHHGRGEVILGVDGKPVRMMGTGQDVTEVRTTLEQARRTALEEARRRAAESAERRMAFLARASAELASSLDYETTLRTVARLAVPEVADWCVVDLVEEGGDLHRLAVEHADPARKELARDLMERYPPGPEGEGGLARVIRTGETLMMREIPDGYLVQTARDQRHLEQLRELGLDSYVVAPLTARGRMLGAISLAFAGTGRRYDEEDRVLVEDLARRAAVAIDNSRLVGTLERAQRRLELQASQLAARNEELQAQADELAGALEARSAFMATVSHELRTPLNAIIGYTQLLEEGVPVALPEEAAEHVQSIGRSARHLLQLIDEILTFSRLEATRETVEEEWLDPREVVDEAQAIAAPLTREKGLDFRVETTDLPGEIRTDPRKLRQIIVNLLGNAVKFTMEGAVRLLVRTVDGRILFRVEDTGPGIAPEEKDHLFEAFWQSDDSRTKMLGGTGLGLTISKRYAELLHGTIDVESVPGEGSAFTLSLPLEGS